MINRLENKCAIITGASRGIGKAIAIGFAREGAKVIVNYYSNKEELEALDTIREIENENGIAYSIKADISNSSEVNYLVNQSVSLLGKIDVLVNNAGICPWADFIDLPIEVWEQTQNINHRGTFLCSQLVARQMIFQNIGGSIITIGSVGAYFGNARQSHYNASKAAVGSLMRSMAIVLGPYAIRCNTILPGCIKTSINENILDDGTEFNKIIERTPLKRLGLPKDIIGAAVFFASDDSIFCTGAELRIDGGISINN